MVKQELARILPENSNEQKAELTALMVMEGRITKDGKELSLLFDGPVMVKVVYFLFKNIFQFEVKINTVRKRNKKKFYFVLINNNERIKYIMRYLNLQKDSNGRLSVEKPDFLKKQLYLKDYSPGAFIRGVFLTSGFVNDPERMYHLEVSCYRKSIAALISDILIENSFFPKISLWQKKWAVYIKKSEQIFEFLRFIGVQRALLNLQDIIARKDLLNKVNRLVNCETANLDKTILSASRQLHHIDIVTKYIGMENLPEKLALIAQARLDNPYASIQELANIIGGAITKSCIFHRLKKIEQLAGEYSYRE